MPSMAYRVPPRIDVNPFDKYVDPKYAPAAKSPTRPAFSRNPSSKMSSATASPSHDPSTIQPNLGKVIDMDIFQQILDLDDDDEHEYSKELAGAFFAQARTAFADMDKAYARKDLKELSSLGHFLKGSSAALGVTRVSLACQKIETYGKLRDDSPHSPRNSSYSPTQSSAFSTSPKIGALITAEEALARIGSLLKSVGQECTLAEKWLARWYENESL